MARQIRDVLLRIRGDTKDAVRKLDGLNTSFTEINQAVELAQKGFRLMEGAVRTTFQALDQAQVIEGVTKGFENLQKQAGLVANDYLAKLQTSTKGLI